MNTDQDTIAAYSRNSMKSHISVTILACLSSFLKKTGIMQENPFENIVLKE
jgi:hypothetical protein